MTTVEQILAEALELPTKEPARIAAALLASLDEEDEDPAEVEAAWAKEIERRADEVLSGKSEGIPWEELRDRLLSRLDRG